MQCTEGRRYFSNSRPSHQVQLSPAGLKLCGPSHELLTFSA